MDFADWAAQVVPIVKTDGTIHLCSDYKLTANKAAKLPHIVDLFYSLARGKSFSKLDLANRLLQKCTFLLPSVEYLGHVISAEGLKPCEKKLQEISEAPRPKDVTQVKSFLELVTYYGLHKVSTLVRLAAKAVKMALAKVSLSRS